MFRRAVIVLAVVVCSTRAAWGADKTDVITLANGDRITGEIVAIRRGQLEFKTDDAGTMKIEWEKVLRVEAARQFEIVTSDGRRLLGSLGGAADRFVLVKSIDGDVSLPIREVTSITPIGASFWRKLDGSVDAGFSYTRSSGVSQTTLNTDTQYRRPAFLMRLTMSASLTVQSGDTNDDARSALEFSYMRYRGQRWFAGGTGRLESNESLGVSLRSQAGGFVGQRLVNSTRGQLLVGGGFDVNNERSVDQTETQNFEGLITFQSSYDAYDSPKTNLYTNIQYYPSLSTWGRQRLQVDTSVKRELFKDFNVGLNLYDTYDSDPPNADAAHNDIGVTASVGWSFGR